VSNTKPPAPFARCANFAARGADRLGLTFQPAPREGRSILNGVSTASPRVATSAEITREQKPGCSSGSKAPAIVPVSALERGVVILHPLGMGEGLLLGFFGAGMPRVACLVAVDSAARSRCSRLRCT
jgi:hypothetical protein